MRNITKLLLLSCSIIATNAHAGSSALGSSSEDDVVSILKRAITKLQGPSPQDQSAKRICRSEDESEATQRPQINVHVKIEPDHTTLPRLLTPNDIEEALPQFNPEKGEKNCLACNTKFVKWIMTGTLEPAEGQDSQGHNIAIYDRFAALLDEQQASDLPNRARIIEIGDHSFQEYIGIDVTQLTLRPKKLRDLDAFFQSLPLTKVANGFHQAGLMYLDYKEMPEPKNVGEITGHYLGFYIYEPQDQPRQTFIVDAQPAKMWPLNQFLEQANAYYADCAYIWWPQDEGNRSSPLPSIKKEKSESEGEEAPAAVDVEPQSMVVQPTPPFRDLEQQLGKAILCVQQQPDPRTDAEAVITLQQALNSQHLPQGLKDKAVIGLARMRYENRTAAITDEQAIQCFQDALNSQYLTQVSKDEAALGLAIMCCANRTAAITDDQAVQYLLQALNSQHLSQVAKDTAALVLAMTSCANHTAAITDDQAARYFLQARNSRHLNWPSKDEATLRLALMRSTNRTDVITDNNAAWYLDWARKSPHLPQSLKDEAALELAMMHSTNRTTIIKDEKAVQYFQHALNSQHLSQGSKDTAVIGLALMRCAKRTAVMTDDQATQHLLQVLNSQHDRQGLKDEAALRLASMRYEKRTSAITDDQAGLYFQQALNSQYLTQVSKDATALRLAIMHYEHRTAAITDEQAVQYLQQALNSQHLSQVAKDTAAQRLARMRCANRTAAITDERAVRLLSSMISSASNWALIKSAGGLLGKLLERM